MRFIQKIKVLELNTDAWTPIKSNITNILSLKLSLYDLQNQRYDFFNYTREHSCAKKNSVLRFTQKVKVLELNTAAWTPLKSTIPNSLSPNLSLYDLQKPRYSYTRLYACSRPGEKMGVVAMGAL